MTNQDATGRPTVGIRVDAGGHTGVGHAVRCLALGQELVRRGHPVCVFGELGVPWVQAGFERIGAPVRTADALPGTLLSHVVIDGYEIPADLGASLRRNGVHVTTLVDDRFGAHQVADLYVDQNLGASPHTGGPDGCIALAGPRYTLFRDEVLAARDAAQSVPSGAPRALLLPPPSVLAVFGGTDPYRASDVIVPLLFETGAPMSLTVVCPDPARADRLRALPHGPHQIVTVVGALEDLGTVAARSDLAVSAAGSTVWELLAIGTPTAVVCVVDNQEPGYLAATEAGIVLPAGRLPRLRADDARERTAAVESLGRLLTDSILRERLSEDGMRLFDGRGRARVADAMGLVAGAAVDAPLTR